VAWLGPFLCMMESASRKFILVLLACSWIHGLARADDLVVVATNVERAEAIATNWERCDAATREQFLVDQHGTAKYILEKTLIEGQDPSWFPMALKLAAREAGSKPRRLGDRSMEERAALQRLLLAGPVNRAPYLREVINDPDFRIGFGLAVKGRFQNGGQSIPNVAEFTSDKFFEELETPGFRIPIQDQPRVVGDPSPPAFVFVLAKSMGGAREQTLRRLAAQRLEMHRQVARSKSGLLYDAAVKDALARLQGCGATWDGKSLVRVADLCPEVSAKLQALFQADYSSLGFTTTGEASAFVRSSTLSNARVNLVVYWAGQSPEGRHSVGYVLSGIRP